MKGNNCANKLLKRSSNRFSGTKFNKLTLVTLKKFDVDLEKVQSEVVVLNVGIIDYEEKSAPSVFGEKKAISYLLDFVIYNIEFQAKLMTFEYVSEISSLHNYRVNQNHVFRYRAPSQSF